MSWKVHQTEGWQQQILAAATAEGALDLLCWFIQSYRPLSKRDRRGLTSEQIVDAQYKTAAWPGDWVPYLPVGDHPQVSRAWADMLAEMFAASNPDDYRFSPALCLRSEVEKIPRRYEFGEPWDCVCSVCGAVFLAYTYDFDICEECIK